MNKNELENGACFAFNDFEFMLSPMERKEQGYIYMLGENRKIFGIVGTYLWGREKHIYITREVMPNVPATVEIKKSECKYIGKIETNVQVQSS